MESIRDIGRKIKSVRSALADHGPGGLFFVICVILVGTLGFGLGRLSRIEEAKVPVKVIQPAAMAAREATTAKSGQAAPAAAGYVASKTGTKYHLPWCSGAQRIKEENKIFFGTKGEAEAGGYSPAANCKGL